MTSFREEKLEIAKKIYLEIMKVIDKYENDTEHDISCCWDECIWVDGQFYSSELHGE